MIKFFKRLFSSAKPKLIRHMNPTDIETLKVTRATDKYDDGSTNDYYIVTHLVNNRRIPYKTRIWSFSEIGTISRYPSDTVVKFTSESECKEHIFNIKRTSFVEEYKGHKYYKVIVHKNSVRYTMFKPTRSRLDHPQYVIHDFISSVMYHIDCMLPEPKVTNTKYDH